MKTEDYSNNILGVQTPCGISKRRPSRFKDCHDLLLSTLKCTVEDYFLQVMDGSDGMKVDEKIKSWSELNEWDLVKGEKKILNFSIDFKAVISFPKDS